MLSQYIDLDTYKIYSLGMEILLFRRTQSPDQHSHHPVARITHFTFLKTIFTDLQISFQLYVLLIFVSLKNFNRNPLKDLTETRFSIFLKIFITFIFTKLRNGHFSLSLQKIHTYI